jgi:hypothetical protein
MEPPAKRVKPNTDKTQLASDMDIEESEDGQGPTHSPTSDRKYRCAVCDQRFERPAHLRRHVNTVHAIETSVKCKHCSVVLKAERCMARHIKKCKALQCPKCEARFVTPEALQLHKQACVARKECSLCGRHYKCLRQLKAHEAKCVGPKSRAFKCKECTASFDSHADIVDHMTAAHGGYSCQFCDKRFKSLSSKNNHENALHVAPKKYECYICGMVVASAGSLHNHLQALHAESAVDEEAPRTKYGKCGQCGRKVRNLVKHSETCDGEKPKLRPKKRGEYNASSFAATLCGGRQTNDGSTFTEFGWRPADKNVAAVVDAKMGNANSLLYVSPTVARMRGDGEVAGGLDMVDAIVGCDAVVHTPETQLLGVDAPLEFEPLPITVEELSDIGFLE